eukprot:1214475-Pyramimonas_sp.AAC.1
METFRDTWIGRWAVAMINRSKVMEPCQKLRCAVPCCEILDETKRETADQTPYEAPRDTPQETLNKAR